VPGTVVALAMILAFLRPVLGISLYNTIWIILVAYVARFLALAVKPVAAAFTQVHTSLEEAARSSGASLSRSLRDVTIPLIRSALVSGWFLAAVPAITELTLSVLLWSAGNETGPYLLRPQPAGSPGSGRRAAIGGGLLGLRRAAGRPAGDDPGAGTHVAQPAGLQYHIQKAFSFQKASLVLMSAKRSGRSASQSL